MYQIDIQLSNALSSEGLTTLLELGPQIPELASGITEAELRQRLENKSLVLLVAYVEGEVAGFKLGYPLDEQTLYSWLGGVAQDFRGLGIGNSLLMAQEEWAKTQGYYKIQVKTQNRFPVMLTTLIGRGYQIVELKSVPQAINQNKMLLEKVINY